MAWCLPARADLAALEGVARDHEIDDPSEARAVVAAQFGFASWALVCAEVERRRVLNARDLEAARDRIAADASWATRDLTGWCDHRHGAAPLNYMAMLRFDAGRLGLTGPLPGTGEMAELLLHAGAPVNGNPGETETPLMTAASYGDADVARVLIAAGAGLDALASPDAGGVAGGSALLHAAVFGMTDVLDAIVTAGARVRSLVEAAAAGDVGGWDLATETEEERIRALIMAADHERLGVIDHLLAAGTPIDALDTVWDRQALRLAAEHGRPSAVRHLLRRGADPALEDREGRTALDLCRAARDDRPRPGHDEVVTLLAGTAGA